MSDRKYIIYGAGKTAEYVYQLISDIGIVKGFTVTNKADTEETLRGLPIWQFEENAEWMRQEQYFIIQATTLFYEDIQIALERFGFQRGTDFEFWRNYLPELLWKEKGILHAFHIEIPVNNLCSLNCKDCMCLQPYMKKPTNRKLEEIIRDIDLFFENVDKTYDLMLIGGEPFLFPELGKLATYIHEKYKSRYERLYLATNGTVIPDKDLVIALKNANVEVDLSIYENSREWQNNNGRVKEILENAGIPVSVMYSRFWVDCGTPGELYWEDEEILKNVFRKCLMNGRVIWEGELYYCSRQCAAYRADLIGEQEEAKISLSIEKNGVEKEKMAQFFGGHLDVPYIQ